MRIAERKIYRWTMAGEGWSHRLRPGAQRPRSSPRKIFREKNIFARLLFLGSHPHDDSIEAYCLFAALAGEQTPIEVVIAFLVFGAVV